MTVQDIVRYLSHFTLFCLAMAPVLLLRRHWEERINLVTPICRLGFVIIVADLFKLDLLLILAGVSILMAARIVYKTLL